MSTATQQGNVMISLGRTNPPIIGPDDSIALARETMKNQAVSHLPVLELDKVVGMISERDILRCPWSYRQADDPQLSLAAPEPIVRHWMSQDLLTLRPGHGIEVAAEQMLTHKVSGLPIVSEQGGLVAMISEHDLARYYARKRPVGDDTEFRPVVDHMTAEVTALDSKATLHQAIMIFTDRPIRHLPVIQGTKPVGMLSDRDLFRHLAQAQAEQRPAFEAANDPVEQAMSTPVRSINQLFTVTQAVRLMLNRQVHALPVVERGELIGIFTTSDILRLLIAEVR